VKTNNPAALSSNLKPGNLTPGPRVTTSENTSA
jgi:hypothetical protein